jgi:dihydropteroate synthase
LLGNLDSFTRWKRPLLLGASRKSFISQVAADDATADRLPGSLACACWGIGHGIHIVRTHDVAATRQAIRVIEAIRAKTR